MALENLRDLFLEQLKDIYDAEHRITKALPKMARDATSEELSSAFEDHLSQTQEHVTRLEQIFKIVGESASKKTCKAAVGLLQEGEELMNEDAPESVKDAALIAAAQKVEHYEMATYGCLRDWAQLLGLGEAADLLQETLDEEGETDKKLTEIAQSLNVEAIDGEAEGMEEEEDGEAPRAERRPAAQARRTGTAGRSTPSRAKARVR
jgi:ferritin-like metal-binding protein YciE